jgi:hypothetical protein
MRIISLCDRCKVDECEKKVKSRSGEDSKEQDVVEVSDYNNIYSRTDKSS